MRCGVCGSERLSAIGELTSAPKWNERLRLRFARPGLLTPQPVFEVGHARACRDCGALIPFLGENERRRLDALADVEGRAPGAADDGRHPPQGG